MPGVYVHARTWRHVDAFSRRQIACRLRVSVCNIFAGGAQCTAIRQDRLPADCLPFKESLSPMMTHPMRRQASSCKDFRRKPHLC